MIIANKHLLGLLSAVVSLVILLVASVVYDSHKNSLLKQEIASITLANSSTVQSLSWLSSDKNSIDVYLDALLPLGTENYLVLLLDENAKLQNATANSIWADAETREQLFTTIRESEKGGSLFAGEMKFVWSRTAIPATPYTLVTLHQEHDHVLKNFLGDFGLPLIILAVFMFWIVVWVSLTLGSLFKKLNKQNTQLEEQSGALAESRDKALAASKAKGTFLANMSHEIRTPLTAVIGYSEALLGSDQTKEDRLEAIKTIHKSSQHVLHVINQILDLSKIEADKLEIERVMVSPVQLLTEVSALMHMQAKEKGLSFKVFYKTPIPETVYTDPTRLKQVLLNLFSNAIKFTREGYVHINVSCLPEKHRLLLEVVDSGIGMSREQTDRVFDAFTQADVSTTRQYGGTGLGLTLSRQFAEILGGGIQVESEPGRGSRFTVEIDTGKLDNVPFVQDVTAIVDAQDATPVVPSHTRYAGNVLLVEDIEANQRLLGMYARKLGATVTFAGNGQEAFEQAMATPFDLILMDMQMPVMNGIDATRLLREHGYMNPIVALTANVSSEDREKCHDAGCDGFLGKPVDRLRFNQVVSSHLRESTVTVDTRPVISQLLEDNPKLDDMVDVYVEELPGVLDALRRAIRNPDWSELKELVHQVKGTGGLYGFHGVTELAAKLEFQVLSEQRGEVEDVMAEFEAYCERIYAGRKKSNNITHLHDQGKS